MSEKNYAFKVMNKFMKYLEKMGYEYQVVIEDHENDTFYLHVPFDIAEDEEDDYATTIAFFGGDYCAAIGMCNIPINVSENRYSAMFNAVNSANFMCSLGNYSFNPKLGKLSFRVSTHFHNKVVSMDSIQFIYLFMINEIMERKSFFTEVAKGTLEGNLEDLGDDYTEELDQKFSDQKFLEQIVEFIDQGLLDREDLSKPDILERIQELIDKKNAK